MAVPGGQSFFVYIISQSLGENKMKKQNNSRPRFGDRNPNEMNRLIKLLNDMEQRLGRKPKKSDVNNKDLGAIRKCFGKWCYALEAAGLHEPSPETIERRLNRKTRAGRKRAAKKERIRKIFMLPGSMENEIQDID